MEATIFNETIVSKPKFNIQIGHESRIGSKRENQDDKFVIHKPEIDCIILGVADGHQGLDDVYLVIEGHDGNAVIRAEALDDPDGAFEGGLQGGAAHGAGAVDDEGEVERGTLGRGHVLRGGLGRGDETDEDVRRLGGGPEEALFQGQDFDGGGVHRSDHTKTTMHTTLKLSTSPEHLFCY